MAHHPPTRLPEQFPSEPAGEGGEKDPVGSYPAASSGGRGRSGKVKAEGGHIARGTLERSSDQLKRETEACRGREGERPCRRARSSGRGKGQRARKLKNAPQRPSSAWSRQGTAAPAPSGPQGQSYSDEVRSTL